MGVRGGARGVGGSPCPPGVEPLISAALGARSLGPQRAAVHFPPPARALEPPPSGSRIVRGRPFSATLHARARRGSLWVEPLGPRTSMTPLGSAAPPSA